MPSSKERGNRSGGRALEAASRCRVTVVLGLLALLAACAEPEPLALEHEVYEVDGGVESLVDSGCDELPEGPGEAFGFGLGTAPGLRPVAYAFNYLFENETVLFSAGVAGEAPLAEREYDATFLRSDAVDDFSVDLGEGFALHMINRAAPGCAVSSHWP